MRFLIDANMPRSAVRLLKRYDHEGVDVRDIGMGGAADADIAVYARQNGLAILINKRLRFCRHPELSAIPIFWTPGAGAA